MKQTNESRNLPGNLRPCFHEMRFICSKGSVAQVEERSSPCCPLASEGAASNQGDHGSPSRCSSSQPDLWKITKYPSCHRGALEPFLKRVERRKRGGGFKLWTRRTGRSFVPRRKIKEVLSVRHVTDDWFHFFEFCNQGHSGLKRHFVLNFQCQEIHPESQHGCATTKWFLTTY